MTRLIDIIRPGDFVATRNPLAYEGCEIGIYLGVAVKERVRVWANKITEAEGLVYIQWINSNKYGLQGVYISDLNKQFYKIRIYGIDRNKHVIYKRMKDNYKHAKEV